MIRRIKRQTKKRHSAKAVAWRAWMHSVFRNAGPMPEGWAGLDGRLVSYTITQAFP